MSQNELDDTFQKWVEKYDPSYRSSMQGGVGHGWIPILEECFDTLKKRGWSGNILQIKEKFGVLRLYISGVTPEFDSIVNLCEERSRLTCEECGKPGTTINRNGWLSTLCVADSLK